MRKTYKLENLDCANCAAKMEETVKKIEGIVSATVSFMTQKFTIEADEDNFCEIVAEAEKAMKKIESDVEIVK